MSSFCWYRGRLSRREAAAKCRTEVQKLKRRGVTCRQLSTPASSSVGHRGVRTITWHQDRAEPTQGTDVQPSPKQPIHVRLLGEASAPKRWASKGRARSLSFLANPTGCFQCPRCGSAGTPGYVPRPTELQLDCGSLHLWALTDCSRSRRPWPAE